MRPNHRNKEYNQTLEHVYETALANMDDKHSKRKNHQKMHIPNILALCWKSAADDVTDSSPGSHKRDELGSNSATTISSPGDEARMGATHTVVENDDSIFLLKEGELGQGSQHRIRSGVIRTTMVHASQSISRWRGRHKQSVYD